MRRAAFHEIAKIFRKRKDLARETGTEPATFSLGIRLKIENKEHSEFRHLFPAIELTGNSLFSPARR
jgi:hypothetical protein